MREVKELIRKTIVWLLTLEARAVLLKYKPHTIIVTGSVGKTSSKDAVYTALSGAHFVRKSEKSFNSDVGVPLTILGLPNGWSNPVVWIKNLIEGLSLALVNAPYPKWLVLEVGADRPGDISTSLGWLKPYAVVATRFPDVPVHVEFYESPRDVVKEELAPASWLTKGGLLAYNADDERAGTISVAKDVKRISFGFENHAEVKGARYLVTSKNKMPAGISFDVSYKGERVHVSLPGIIGRTHAYAVLAGIATAVGVGIPLQSAARAFENHTPPPGRTRLIAGRNGSIIIDDSYNSSPVATEEALKALADCPRRGKRIAVLADMLELGVHSVPEHKRVGGMVSQFADVLITVGVRSRDTARSAREAGMPEDVVIECNHTGDAITVLTPLVQDGDIVVMKGSQSMRMEKVVQAFMHDPSQAKELLVRQDTEWDRR